jgi:hypothetical protein
MDDKQLLGTITAGLPEERKDKLRRVLLEYINSSQQFKVFLENYRDKIHSKLSTPLADEDFDDIFLEIWLAYQLIQNIGTLICSVEYERCGNASGPDFIFNCVDDFTLNVEVKRIREYPLEIAFNDLCKYLKKELEPLLSGINIILRLNSFDSKDLILPKHLYCQNYRLGLVNFISKQIDLRKSNNVKSHHSVDYCRIVKIQFFTDHVNGLVLNSFTQGPIPFYYDAKNKIADVIRKAMKQVLQNESNIIAIGTSNLCYDCSNFFEEVKALQEEHDADSRFQFVTGILYKGWGTNELFLWLNENANFKLTTDLKESFELFTKQV